MTTKRPLIAGNWKMELTHKGALEVARALKEMLKGKKVAADIVVCPSYISLPAVAEVFRKTKKVSVGAQNIHNELRGAYTGQVSVEELQGVATWCIVGHSEVRAMTGESDELVVKKATMLLERDMHPIICIGETATERDAGQAAEKITRQMDAIVSGLTRAALTKVAIAYEPIWAIGTGVLPEPDEATEAILLIRRRIAERFDKELSDRVRVLYGGSVKPENVAPYIGGPGADGVLVGGASVHPKEFVDIVLQVEKSMQD